MELDWKFLLALLITLAGVAVPVWLWQADQSSKTLSVKLATRIALLPKEQESIPGMEMSVDGSRLEKPYLVVFEIRNDGSKPISAADFESPVQIELNSETSFVHANVTGRIPKDIETRLLSTPKVVSLKPTLLNPGDIVSITVVTSGAPPDFNVKARVVGVPNVALKEGTAEKHNKAILALLVFGAFFSAVSYSLIAKAVIDPAEVHLRRRAAAFVGIVAVIFSAIALQTFLEEIGVQGFWYVLLSYAVLMVPACFMANALNRDQKSARSGTRGK